MDDGQRIATLAEVSLALSEAFGGLWANRLTFIAAGS